MAENENRFQEELNRRKKRNRFEAELEERLLRAQQSDSLEQRLARAQENKPGNPFVEDAPGNPFSPAKKFSLDNPFAFSPDNPFIDQPEISESASEAFIKTAGRTFANNLLGLPSAAGEILALGAAGAETAAAGFDPRIGIPGLAPDGPTFGERFQEQREKFPASMLRNFRPTVEGLTADVRSLPKLFPGGETFGESRQRLRSEFASAAEQRRERFPGITFAGDVTGDIATLVSGRAPAARGIKNLEQKLFGKGDELFFGGAIPKIVDPGTRRVITEWITGPGAKSLARGAGRSLEAGFEAAALDLLKGDDPLETAGYVAAVQLGGSATLGIFKGAKKHPGIAAGALVFASLLQVSKNFVPGGEDSFIDSIEAGYGKVAFAIGMGLVAGAAGTGRLRTLRRSDDWPKIMDAISTIPRANMISLLEDFVDADPVEQQKIETIINKLAEDPLFFGKEITPKLQSAMENNRFAEELRELQNDKKFTQKLFSLAPPTLQEQRLED